MIGFLEPCLPFVFTSSRGTGLALRSFSSVSSNLFFSTFILSYWCYDFWRLRWDSDPRNLFKQVRTDYKSDAISHSATQPLIVVRTTITTTVNAASLLWGGQHLPFVFMLKLAGRAMREVSQLYFGHCGSDLQRHLLPIPYDAEPYQLAAVGRISGECTRGC